METITAPNSILDVILRLAVSVVLSGAIGINRELERKPAGTRTHALVALGSATFTIVALLLDPAAGGGPRDAMSRVVQGIVAGIGFVGGGVILHRGDPQGVHGLTTAASIWVVAALGIVVGLGLWWTSATVVVLTLLVLIVGEPIDRAIHKLAMKKRD